MCRGWLQGKPISSVAGICLSIRYTFPDEHAPTELKIIQEAASSIKGFYFSAGRLTAVSKEEGTGYYAVYVLFDSPAPGQRPRVYIG